MNDNQVALIFDTGVSITVINMKTIPLNQIIPIVMYLLPRF